MCKAGRSGLPGCRFLGVVVLATGMAAAVGGCAGAGRESGAAALPSRVAVATFEDQRESDYEADSGRDVVASEASAAMPAELAADLVGHLRETGLFRSVTLVGASGSPPAREFLGRLAADGYDGVITGELRSCGGATGETGGRVAGRYMLRLISFMVPVLLPVPFSKYCNEGVVAVTELRLTDTRSGAVLWREDLSRRATRYTAEPAPGAVARDAMRAACGAITDDLREGLSRREPHL
jgi:hypothetical protein